MTNSIEKVIDAYHCLNSYKAIVLLDEVTMKDRTLEHALQICVHYLRSKVETHCETERTVSFF
jgi:hypothetical protein